MADLNEEYWIYDDNDGYAHILPTDECLRSLKQRLVDMEGTITSQRKMISEMDQNQSVDARIEELQKQNDILQRRLSKSFKISDMNWNKIHKWQKEHDKQHGEYPTAGERYVYEFLPTGIITCVTCRCGLCKEAIDFYEE